MFRCRAPSRRKNDSAAVGFKQILSRIAMRMDLVRMKSPRVAFAVASKALQSARTLTDRLSNTVVSPSAPTSSIREGKFISLSTRWKSGTHTHTAYVCHIL